MVKKGKGKFFLDIIYICNVLIPASALVSLRLKSI